MNLKRVHQLIIPVFIILTFCFVLVGFNSCNNQNTTILPRNKLLFDSDWYFHIGDIPNREQVNLDDLEWRKINLPHDWSIEDLPGKSTPFDSMSIGGNDYGYLIGGTAWYRKKFSLPKIMKDKKVSLMFEGVYMNTDVWINGNHLGNHPYGYTGFEYNITDFLNHNGENILEVEVKNEGRTSRWYPGSGIYRHVWLIATNPVYVATWGTEITTPEVNNSSAKVLVKNLIVNETEIPATIQIHTKIISKSGQIVSEVQTDQIIVDSTIVTQELLVENPKLWSIDSPELYTAVSEIYQNSHVIDIVETKLGIRTIRYSTEGFFLNGKNILMQGGCMHHDNGPLGSAAYDRAEERRVELMKANGFNAIRCAHNPPSTVFLDACDRLGMLVIDEAFDMWRIAKRPQDYHLYFDQWWKKDIESMVLRDRNHPSVIMWSIGNEIPERATAEGVEIAKMLADYVRKLDPTRPVTSAVNGLNPDKDPYFATLDVSGYNYAAGGDHGNKSVYEKDHERIPDRIMYGAESYPLESFDAWMQTTDNPFVIGDFVWTGFDYLGEASIGWLGQPVDNLFYPWNHAFCGDIDICGFKRPQSYYRDVLWKIEDGYPLSIFVEPPEPSFSLHRERVSWSKWWWHDVVADWNWPGYEGNPVKVFVYNMYPEVELFLNGKSLGKQKTTRENEWIAEYTVPYSPGELKAVAYDSGQQKAIFSISTSANPTQIVLKADRSLIKANGQDLSYITVELQDKNGIINPKKNDLIRFEIEGPGEIIAVGNSNPKSTESFQAPCRKLYKGRCLVILKSGSERGLITLKAIAKGLAPATISIETE